jgi:hypothetical protein
MNELRRDNVMSIQNVSPEQLAELFHHYHEILGPDVDFPGRPNDTWAQLPPQAQRRLVAAARLALTELASTAREQEASSLYFARPGAAEWGC